MLVGHQVLEEVVAWGNIFKKVILKKLSIKRNPFTTKNQIPWSYQNIYFTYY